MTTPTVTKRDGARTGLWQLTSAPVASESVGGWTAEKRRQYRQRQLAGDLTELEFEAVVYRAGRNANYVRFRQDGMHEFTASFVGVPFLRNHDTGDIGARDGMVIRSWMTPDLPAQILCSKSSPSCS